MPYLFDYEDAAPDEDGDVVDVNDKYAYEDEIFDGDEAECESEN